MLLCTCIQNLQCFSVFFPAKCRALYSSGISVFFTVSIKKKKRLGGKKPHKHNSSSQNLKISHNECFFIHGFSSVSMFFKEMGLQELPNVFALDGGLLCFSQSRFTHIVTEF